MPDSDAPAALPQFTDLGALADEMGKRGNIKLRAIMTQAWRAQSCLGDLRQAMDCADVLATLIKRPKSEDTPHRFATERALLVTAISLYARATSTSGDKGERGSIQLAEKKVTPEEWADHRAIIDVRNEAMAHVYSSRSLGDHRWHTDIFFAVNVGKGRWQPASASNQTGFHAGTFARLERALPVAHRELRIKFHERMDAVSKMINNDVKGELLRKYVFDPVAAFGSEEGVRTILAGAPQVEAALWVNEGDRRSDN